MMAVLVDQILKFIVGGLGVLWRRVIVPFAPWILAAVVGAPAVVGSIVAPVTAEERAAVRQHLQSDAETRAWGERGWERAGIAREACRR